MNHPEEPSVGIRLRAVRKRQGLSLRALAERCGLSVNAISRIERGENSPTVSSLHLLATALNIPIATLFAEGDERATVFVKSDRRPRSYGSGTVLESLGTGLPDQELQPFLMTIEPGPTEAIEPVSHPREELVYCLEGEVEYRVGDRIYHMAEGDSLLFDASQRHSCLNTGPSTARILLVFQASLDQPGGRQLHLRTEVPSSAAPT